MHYKPIKHCRNCGQSVAYRLPDDGDSRERAICPDCHTVHYENPLNVVGTVPSWGPRGEQVLLCRRNIEPRWGKWTLPAGFMELGESIADGAMRETDEESGANIDIGRLFTVISVPDIGQVHMYFMARMLDTELNPGPETIEARLFFEHEIPWEELAFRTVKTTLEHYFADLKRNQFDLHVYDILHLPKA